MNTLSKTDTATFITQEERAALEAQWRTIRNTASPAHHLLYAALRGKDWRKGFTPPKNQTWLNNGGFYQWALWNALNYFCFFLHSEQGNEWSRAQCDDFLKLFGGTVTVQMYKQVCVRIPAVKHALKAIYAAAFAGEFPFPAYVEDRARELVAS